MLTLMCLVAYSYSQYKEYLERMKYARILGRYGHEASLLLRSKCLQTGPVQIVTSDSAISPLVSEVSDDICEKMLESRENQQLLSVSPKFSVNLKYWVSYLDKQDISPIPQKNSHYVLFETYPPEEDSGSEYSEPMDVVGQVKVTDHAVPVAWKGGTPFGILAECTNSDLVCLISAFMKGNLIMDDMLQLRQMMALVNMDGHARNLLHMNGANELSSPTASNARLSQLCLHDRWEVIIDDLHSSIGGDAIRASNESLASSSQEPPEKLPEFAFSADNSADICEISEECSEENMKDGHVEPGAGESLSGPLEELAPEALTPNKRRIAMRSKPPNVLVYCGKKNSTRQFDHAKATLQTCLNPEKYVIYQLTQEQVLTSPWADNTRLLVLATEKLYDGVDEAFLNYFYQGGLMISFGSVIDDHLVRRVKTVGAPPTGMLQLAYKRWSDVSVISMPFHYDLSSEVVAEDIRVQPMAHDQEQKNVVMVEVTHEPSDGVALLAQVNLEKGASELAISPAIFAALKQSNPARCEILADLFKRLGLDSQVHEVAKPTAAVLHTTSQALKNQFSSSIKGRLSNGILRSRQASLHIVKSSSGIPGNLTGSSIPLVVPDDTENDVTSFDLAEYRANLQSSRLGHTVIHADVMPTTMHIVDALMLSMSSDQGLAVFASQQSAGKGRSGNSWLSPCGCAMMSAHLRIPLTSTLGRNLAFLQHIAAVSVVHGIRSLPGYEDLEVCLKWPNDIYFSNKMKMGGIFVQSSVMQNDIHFNVGVGFNVSNSNPTICLNDLIEQHNHGATQRLELLSVEAILGRTLTVMDHLVAEFQTNGPATFLELYYKYWLHSDQIVKLEAENGVECKILGLDDTGYLLVQTPDGSTKSLQPDGNSFDMMRNMIVIKNR